MSHWTVSQAESLWEPHVEFKSEFSEENIEIYRLPTDHDTATAWIENRCCELGDRVVSKRMINVTMEDEQC